MDGVEEATSLLDQWPLLGAALLGIVAAVFLMTKGREWFGAVKGDGGGNGNADLRAFIGAKFDGLGSQIASVKEDVTELKAELKTH